VRLENSFYKRYYQRGSALIRAKGLKMTSNFKSLMIAQIDDALAPYRAITPGVRPANGWAKAIREAIGMTKEQLAKRLHVSASTVNTLERSEARSAITLDSLDRLARGLNCHLVYAIVPNDGKTLEQLVHERAEVVARQRLSRVSHTMMLEEQGLEERQEQRQLKRTVEALLAGSKRALWR
jgi:predicted DNA-binding mobile mystery protein A